MFTGIIEEIGEVAALESHGDSAVLTLAASTIADDLVHGASIAVNGVCLTVVGWRGEQPTRIDFDVMGETLDRSVIGALRAGSKVNLERAARADSRLDGHIVQGHVDGTGVIVSRTPGDAWDSVRFGVPAELSRALDEEKRRRGTSLNRTVLELLAQALGLGSSAPHTNGLADLAGTWSKVELEQFEQAVALTEQIDEEVWR